MAIILNGTTGITTPDIDSTAGFDGEDLTGDVAAARITGALNATGSAPIYACRAWVNFNGTGTVAIRASGNVSSITDNATGDYTVNFATALPDANYSVTALAGLWSASAYYINLNVISASSVRVLSAAGHSPGATSGSSADSSVVCVAIFR